MRAFIPKAVFQAALIGVGFVSAVFCQTTAINQEFGITSPGTGTNQMGGVYTDPYQGRINATAVAGTDGTQVVAGTGTNIAAFCDDFTNDVYPPQFWNANETDLNAFSDSNGTQVTSVYYQVANATQQTTDYIAVAMLALDSLQAASGTGAFGTGGVYASVLAGLSGQQLADAKLKAQEQLSFALWDIFDTAVLAHDCTVYGCLDSGANSSTAKTLSGTPNWYAASNYATDALTAAAGFTTGAAYENSVHMDVEIYSEANANGVVDTSSSRPQEFVTVTSSGTNFNPTPEPSMLAFLGFDGVGVGIIGLYFRRRQLRSRE